MERTKVDFTREPIIETVITPKDGWTLVVRSSKSSGQEEYFVDAVEVITFGGAVFFRSRERPKSFMVPVSDYEVLEVRETRLVLKNVGLDRSIKIGGGREALSKPAREPVAEKAERHLPQALQVMQAPALSEAESPVAAEGESAQEALTLEGKEARLDKRRDRKRNYRRKRAREGVAFREEEGAAMGEEAAEAENAGHGENGALQPVTSVISSLLPPPPTLISETIARYKDNALFKGAFFLKDEHQGEEALDFPEGQASDLGAKAFEESDKHADDLSEAIEVPHMSLDFPVYSKTESIEEASRIYAVEQAEEAAGIAEASVQAAQDLEVYSQMDAFEGLKADSAASEIEEKELLPVEEIQELQSNEQAQGSKNSEQEAEAVTEGLLSVDLEEQKQPLPTHGETQLEWSFEPENSQPANIEATSKPEDQAS